MKKISRFEIKLQKNIILIGVFISTIFYLINGWRWSISFMIGVAGALIYLRLLAKQISNLKYNKSYKVKKTALMGLMLRYLTILIIFIVCSQIELINIYLVMGGLAMIPFSSVITYTMLRNEETK